MDAAFVAGTLFCITVCGAPRMWPAMAVHWHVRVAWVLGFAERTWATEQDGRFAAWRSFLDDLYQGRTFNNYSVGG